MGKRISSLKESPCSKCGLSKKCEKKIKNYSRFSEIRDAIFGNADFDYHDCGIWIALKVENKK